MTENDIQLEENNQTAKIKRPKKKFLERRSSWIFLTFLLAFLIVLVGGILGIPKGINDRVQLAEAQALPKVQAQLESAQQDIAEERYEVALGRLDWILDEMAPYLSQEKLDEVGELYSQTLLNLSAYSTPTPMPSPTPTVPVATPTPDLRGEEELYTTAQQQIAEEAWEEAIQTLEALRQKNLDYKTIQVDGMQYVALRNRGVKKILVDGSLEPGIYDLTLAERFAPLDASAEGFRTWARYYLTGASYWGVDWSQVVYYFEQVYPMLPNLRDGTFMTATERFRYAAIEYAEELEAAGDVCAAQEYLEKALAISPDPELQADAEEIAEQCFNLLNPPTPTPTEAPGGNVPQPTQEPPPVETEVPTESPTEEPTEEPTGEPTEEPGPP
jgi:tetratricopeptide (TPR) repeat protein